MKGEGRSQAESQEHTEQVGGDECLVQALSCKVLVGIGGRGRLGEERSLKEKGCERR